MKLFKLDCNKRKAVRDSQPELVRLHQELCPNCPFDGKTIFSREKI